MKCPYPTIYLKAHLKDELKWDIPDLSSYSKVIWEIDLGFANIPLSIEDSFVFQAHFSALEYFASTIFLLYKDKSAGVILYRGDDHFEERFEKGDLFFIRFEEWQKDLKYLEPHPFYLRLFAAGVLGEYLHRLVSCLPEDLPIYIEVDPLDSSPAQQAILLSPLRFEHMVIIASGQEANEKAFTGVVVPLDTYISEETLKQLEGVYGYLNENSIPYKMLSEAFLTEEWNELSYLILLQGKVSPMGLRKLKGFIAAGGKVFSYPEVQSDLPIEHFSIKEFAKSAILIPEDVF